MKQNKKKYLLISAKPAPNGELHLGHLSGPFLAQDMYYRHLTSLGMDVKVMSGTDPIDSFIPLRADASQQSALKLSTNYFEIIKKNFSDYSFHYDIFINPMEQQWKKYYVETMKEVVDTARKSHKTQLISAKFPYSTNTGKPASGAWICGKCPDCKQSISGYFCEACGAHIEPSEIIDAKHRNNDEKICFKNQTDEFFLISNPGNLIKVLKNSGVRDDVLSIVYNQFEKNRYKIRLTEDSAWGVTTGKSNQVYFGHGLLYAYCRLLGDIYKIENNSETHPFDQDSDITTINFFGLDNTASHMINIQAIGEETPSWKAFDHFVVNHFYLLNGEKFSTSAGHMISASDILRNDVIKPCSVRFVLAATSPAEEVADFTANNFIYWHNSVLIDELFSKAKKIINSIAGRSIQLNNEMFKSSLWKKNCDCFEYHSFNPRKIIKLIREHVAEYPSEKDINDSISLNWLVQFSLLLYPVSPVLATAFWRACGLTHTPNINQISNKLLTVTTIDFELNKVAHEDILNLFL